jgi:antitoxin component of MazEF toxin-antitoxin module
VRKKLSAVGNSLGLVIEKPILELLDITRETELEMKTDGERLIIEPVRKGRKSKKDRIRDAVEEIMRDHESTLRKLAK